MEEEPIYTQNNSESHPIDIRLQEAIEQWQRESFSIDQFFDLQQAMISDDIYRQHYGVIGFRKLMSNEHGPPIQPFIDANLVPRVIEFILNDSKELLQSEACWLATNLSSGTTQQTRVLIDHGVIPCLIRLLKLNTDTQKQAFWALGNISGDCWEFRDIVLNHDGLHAMIDALSRSGPIRDAVWALSNLCRGRPLPNPILVKPAIPTFCDIIAHADDQDILIDATWALNYIIEHSPKENLDKFTKIIPKILHLLSSNSLAIVLPCLNLLASSIKAYKRYNMDFQHSDLLPWIFRTLGRDRRAILVSACTLLLEIIKNFPDFSDTIINNPHYMDILIKTSSINQNSDVGEIIFKIIVTINANVHPGQISDIVDMGVFDYLLFHLKTGPNDSKLLILEAIDNILSKGAEISCGMKNELLSLLEVREGLKTIENLQEHPSDEVYEKAFGILEKYFKTENILDSEL